MTLIDLTKAYINNHSIGFEFTPKDFIRYLEDNGLVSYNGMVKNIPEDGKLYNRHTAHQYLRIIRGAGYISNKFVPGTGFVNTILKPIPENKGFNYIFAQYNNLRKNLPMPEEKINIPKKEYDRLIRLANYVNNWCSGYESCNNCGEYHPKGCICVECGYDNSTGKIRR